MTMYYFLGHRFESVARRSPQTVKGGSPTGVRNGSCRPVGSGNRHAARGSLPVTADSAMRSPQRVPRRVNGERHFYFILIFLMENFFLQQLRIAHGSDVFQSHWSCHCKACEQKRSAVSRLVESFATIPAKWIEELAEHRGNSIAMPMWGSVFVSSDRADQRAIAALLQPLTEEDDDERATLAASGWSEVGTTGVLALSLDEELILGVHGAGYDFFSAHWEPLYDQLGYHWHECRRQ
ncbi:MAG: hypothetical protein JWM11_6842 [Planctomycetaceae bacterium]|nr:hypothetical protein [Planctomycetaceae bacterium]